VPQVDLVTELLLLYRAAGRPSYRKISTEIRERDDMPDTVSHETVGALLTGTFIPRWSKVECVVRQLASMAVHRPDPETEVQRFLELWAAASDARINSTAAPSSPERADTPETPRDSPPAHDLPPVEPQTGSAPARNLDFTGREEILSAINTELSGDPWQPLVLHGLSGVGKTSIAVEYVHRVRDEYDVIWWIVAEQVSQARSALVALGARHDLPISQDMGQTVRAMLGRLESADFKWLIVFDNAAGPTEIGPLLPAAGGAVIVTTRNADWLSRGRAMSIDVLPRADSIRLLQSRGNVSFDEADQLAERLGDLPLALEQAAAMRSATRISVSEYLRLLGQQATVVLDQGRPSDYPETVASAFAVTFNQVKRDSAGTAQLLAMLSCLSAEPVSLTLLRAADESIIQPPLGRLLGQEASLRDAVRLLRSFGLITAVDADQRVQVHRLVQLIVRDSLTPVERDQAYANARRLLVAANPGLPDSTLTWEMHAQIGPHVEPARAVEGTESGVRRVVLDQIRYLYVLGDYEASLRLSEDARRAWAGPDDIWADNETFACLDRLASALTSLGRYSEADEIYAKVWDQLSKDPAFGPENPRTVRMASGVANVSRVLGRYDQALRLEQYRVEHYRTRADPRLDEELLRAQSNLAVTYRLIGNFSRAREIDEALVERRRQALGEDNYQTLFSISNLARDLYGLGLYAEALDLQQRTIAGLRSRLNSRHQYVLLAQRTIALGLRKTGRLTEALRRSREHFYLCTGEFGSDHGHTLAAAMTYANAIRAVTAAEMAGEDGGYSLAYNLSVDTVNRYRRRFGDNNPLTLVAATNQAAILRAMGERIRARRIGEPAYHTLEQRLGAGHPYTQAAAIGLANDLVANREEREAARRLRATLEDSRVAGRQTHPDMLICAINLALISREVDGESGQAMLSSNLDALRSALGPDNPQVQAATRGQRAECDIEPPAF
jgi:tetratricopeptide (TPR) repeat protein